jgi:HlyD family secretion protein
MTSKRKLLIAAAAVGIVAASLALAAWGMRDQAVEVRAELVGPRDLESVITATGRVRPRRHVNVSSDVMGRVIELNVQEGDEVERGMVLLRVDPSAIQTQVSSARAALSQSEAQASQARANLVQAERDLARLVDLRDRDPNLVSRAALEEAETRVQIQRSALQSAEFGAIQARARVDEVEEQRARTTITAPISGRITRLNIEEGETVVVGTMNNPGSLLLTVSDLSIIETVLAVDETDVPRISVGDPARVQLDAYPGRDFTAAVTRISDASISTSGAGAPARGSVDFEVFLTLMDPPPQLRPDLSATADIVVDRRPGVLSVPIIAVTLRDGVEGVFVIEEGRAVWTPVELGITGAEHFEVRSGLREGMQVVSGPYQQIQLLQDGASVRVADPESGPGG